MTWPRPFRIVKLPRGAHLADAPELADRPGVCAGCLRTFEAHDDHQLAACAASYEETQPTGSVS